MKTVTIIFLVVLVINVLFSVLTPEDVNLKTINGLGLACITSALLYLAEKKKK